MSCLSTFSSLIRLTHSSLSSYILRNFIRMFLMSLFPLSMVHLMLSSHCVSQHYASMGLATILLGVSGSWDGTELRSLPIEFEPRSASWKQPFSSYGMDRMGKELEIKINIEPNHSHNPMLLRSYTVLYNYTITF